MQNNPSTSLSMFFFPHPDTEVLKMKRVLESLASSNNEKVQCDVMLLLNSCFDLHEAAVTGTSCMFLSAGTKDKRAGGDSDKVQESAGVGQRSACDHRTNTNVVYFT